MRFKRMDLQTHAVVLVFLAVHLNCVLKSGAILIHGCVGVKSKALIVDRIKQDWIGIGTAKRMFPNTLFGSIGLAVRV